MKALLLSLVAVAFTSQAHALIAKPMPQLPGSKAYAGKIVRAKSDWAYPVATVTLTVEVPCSASVVGPIKKVSDDGGTVQLGVRLKNSTGIELCLAMPHEEDVEVTFDNEKSAKIELINAADGVILDSDLAL